MRLVPTQLAWHKHVHAARLHIACILQIRGHALGMTRMLNLEVYAARHHIGRLCAQAAWRQPLGPEAGQVGLRQVMLTCVVPLLH